MATSKENIALHQPPSEIPIPDWDQPRDEPQWVDDLAGYGDLIRGWTWGFCLGLVKAHDQLGESFYGVVAEAAARLSLDESTLINYESIVRQAINGGYAGVLTVGHAGAVCRKQLTPENRKALIIMAREKGWTVSQLREQVRNLLGGGEPKDDEKEPKARLAFDGTESHQGVITITPNGKHYHLVFDGESLSFECDAEEIKELQS